jgi:dCMP deaminase
MTVDPLSEKWHRRFLNMATLVSTWSKDPSTKVGAVIVRPETRSIVSTGFNGLPRGIADNDERLRDREYKMLTTVHAEMNAILHAARTGVLLEGCIMYCTWMPCAHCAAAIVQSGIRRVIIPHLATIPERWRQSFDHASATLWEARVDVAMLPANEDVVSF